MGRDTPEGFPDLNGRPWLVIAVTAVVTGVGANTLTLVLPLLPLPAHPWKVLVQGLLVTSWLVLAVPAVLRALDGWVGPMRTVLIAIGAILGYLLYPASWRGSAFWAELALPHGLLAAVVDAVLWVAVVVWAWRWRGRSRAETAVSG